MTQILKLGRLAKRHDKRTLKLSNYLKATAPIQFPSVYQWGAEIKDWLMLANDSLGDCTIAAALHMVMLWRKEHGVDFAPQDADAIALYSQFAGYDPAKPETDGGAVELDILKSWRKTGIAGQQISAFVEVDHTNIDEIKSAMWLFGAVYTGITLTQCAMSEFQGGTLWHNTTPCFCGKEVLGGHAIPLVGYTENLFTSVTWQKQQALTVPWWQTYGDEAWAVISPDWADITHAAPNGFDIDALMRDLDAINNYPSEGNRQ